MAARVPFSDLPAAARDVWAELGPELTRAALAGDYIGGPGVRRFEQEWADYCGAEHAVGVANGTDALLLLFEGLGIGRGDDVVVPGNTFVATVEAVLRSGATPVFADVDPGTLLLTPATLEAALTPHTRAVVAVHLYGQPADMPGLQAVTDRVGAVLLEDAAQAHGAEWEGHRVGSLGLGAAFSFYPGKNLGAFGDGGAVVTSDAELAERVRTIANHGRPPGQQHDHDLVGLNSRLDVLQALVLTAKLGHLERWTKVRVELAEEYQRRLAGSPVRFVATDPRARPVYHVLAVRVPERDAVRAALAGDGIETGIHYPRPCHQLSPLRRYATGPLPAVEQAASELLSLPLSPHMTTEQVAVVCEALLDAVPDGRT